MVRHRLLFTGSILWIIAISVSATVLLSVPLFYLDIGWEHLTDVSGFDFQTLAHNYNVLMAYELNPFIAHLRMPDFPDSASALKHFAEVRQLFTLVNLLSLILLPTFILFVKERIYVLYQRGIRLAMLIPVLLALIAASIGFDNFFILFHEVLFRDNTWLFDPLTDPIINVLTDNFFMLCFIIFAVIYEALFASLLILGRKGRHLEKTNS